LLGLNGHNPRHGRSWPAGLRPCRPDPLESQLVWQQCKAAEEAGAFAVEIEVVPQAITEAIAEKTGLFLISMGAGPAGHAQYLFSDDVLGQNRGRVPRHAKIYADFAAEQDRLQGLRIAAMSEFNRDVLARAYPSSQYLVESDKDVAERFRDWLDQVA
jgi:3-methyl-2-oxobutanoate hydroxymethyltransferase